MEKGETFRDKIVKKKSRERLEKEMPQVHEL